MAAGPAIPKPIVWMASSRKDLRRFPAGVRETMGQALFAAQLGSTHRDAKPLKGYKGAGVLEIVEDDDGKTYRAVYTVKFTGFVYVLHAFQKKSKKGMKTPKPDLDLVKGRLKDAQEDYRARTKSKHSRRG